MLQLPFVLKVVSTFLKEISHLQFAYSNYKCNTQSFLMRPNHYESNVNISTLSLKLLHE